MWRGLHNGYVIRCEPKLLLLVVIKNNGKLVMMDFTLRMFTIDYNAPAPLHDVQTDSIAWFAHCTNRKREKLGGGAHLLVQREICSYTF